MRNRGPGPAASARLAHPPHQTFTFVGGKGGAGKTTCAAAAAVYRAELGRRVVVVSTDPAHSLGDALDLELAAKPTAVRVRRGRLDAVELDADRALERWLRVHRPVLVALGERGTFFDRADIERLFDLSFAGVSELLAFAEVVRLASAAPYDEVLVDTAPTGHTLRLLETPESLARLAGVLDDLQAKHRALVQAVSGGYREDAADRLVAALAGEARRLGGLLRDPARVRFAWVTIPEPLAIDETRDAIAALERGGIAVDTLVLNRLSPAGDGCRSCRARRRAEALAVRGLPAPVTRGRTIRRVPALAAEPVGLSALRAVGRVLAGLKAGAAGKSAAHLNTRSGTPTKAGAASGKAAKVSGRNRALPVAALIDAPPRLVFSMGKGGVGKTTCAAALAIALAKRHRRRRVLLLSVDPAHSIAEVLNQPVGNEVTEVRSVPGLFARELDARVEFERARTAYLTAVDELFGAAAGGSSVDATYDRRVTRDLIELAPPGIDELFALITIIGLATDGRQSAEPDRGPARAPRASPGADGRMDHLVVDTAPTGHAIRLLEMREQAHGWVRALMAVLLKYREVLRPGALAAELVAFSKGLRQLDALLKDARATALIPVTRAAALPRAETVRLVAALRALRLPAPAFVVVNALTAARPDCPGCRARAAAERSEVRRLRAALRGCAIILAPALAPPPRGVAALARWIERWVHA